MEPPRWTLSTGPGPLAPAVQAALAQPLVHHADPWFRSFYAGLIAKLQRALAAPTPPAVLQMEAVGAIEALVAGLVRPGETVLALVDGPYGCWLADLARARGAMVHVLQAEPRRAVDPGTLASLLDRTPSLRPALVTVVHVETPHGTRAPLQDLTAELRRRCDPLILCDAVASWPGERLDLEGWDLDAVALGAQKCLGAAPGVTPVWLSQRAWGRVEANPAAPAGSFLSLAGWREVHRPAVPFPFTPSVLGLYALDAALDALLAEGALTCRERHRSIAAAWRAAVARLGLELWPADPAAAAADSVTVARMPPGTDARDIRRSARERHGVELADGVGELEGRVLRIGHMGEAARPEALAAGVAALTAALREASCHQRR